ncbi:MAG: hypothetical protein H7281_16340 [Bacteriovorax sp.]|nr:hypothetical protein [Bacteriovorax sp.]
MKFSLFFLILMQLVFATLSAQDLMKERIRKLSSNKTSIYIEKGIFHNGGVKQEAVLKSIRQSFNSKQGFERIVIDFNSNQIPKVYGHISSQDKKLYIDLFDTTIAKDFQTIGSKHFVEKINFFPIESNYLSLEMNLKAKVTADIFYLENPARLVIDLKN